MYKIKTLPHPIPPSLVKFLEQRYAVNTARIVLEYYERYGKVPNVVGPHTNIENEFADYMFNQARAAAMQPVGDISPA